MNRGIENQKHSDLVNDNIQNHQSKPTQPTSSLKCLLVFVASLIGSPFMLTTLGRWPTSIPGVLGALLGATIALFAVAMLVSILIRGWPGVGAGVIVVIVVICLNANNQRLKREELREHPALAPTIPQATATRTEPNPAPSFTQEVTKPTLEITKLEYKPKENSLMFTVTNKSDEIVTKFTWEPIFMRISSNCGTILNDFAESLSQGKLFSNDNETTKKLIESLGALERQGIHNTLNGYPNGICLPNCPPTELEDEPYRYSQDRKLSGMTTTGPTYVGKSTLLVNIPPKTSYTVAFVLDPFIPVKIPLFYIKIFDVQCIPDK